MANQLVISSGAKVRNLDGVLTGTSGIVNSVPLGAANGVATLDSGGKVPVSQLPSSVVTYLGTWDAATNTPTLVNGTGDAGDMYICNVAGTVNFGAGPVTFAVGDWVLYGSGTWQKSNGQNGTVTSVGVSRDGDALSITGSPITTAGTINIGFTGSNGQYINGEGDLVTFPSLTGFVPYTGATSNVDLGSNDLIAYAVNANILEASLYGTASSPLILKTGTSGFVSGLEAISLISSPSSANTLSIISNVSSVTKTAQIGLGSLSATRTYTLPDASGTLALTSDLSDYVPYTGATADVDLGTYALNAGPITSEFGVAFKIGVLGILYQIGYSTISTLEGTVSIGQAISSGNTKAFTFDFSSWATNTTRTFTLPDLSGTLALLEGSQTFSGVKKFDSGLLLKEGIFTSADGYTAICGEADGLNIITRVGASAYNNSVLFTNATSNTFTFPNASGTLALTSDLSGYVPYTGATANLNMGGYGIISNGIIIEGTVNGAAVNLKQNSTTQLTGAGYNSIGAKDANTLYLYYGGATSSDWKSVSLKTTNIPNTTGRVYEFPNADGTIALTSDIPSLTGYVPYTGATANVNLGTYGLTAGVGAFSSSGGSGTFTIDHSSGSGVALTITKGGNGEGLVINKTSGSGNALSVTGSTSVGALSGTSATFSGNVSINANSARLTVSESGGAEVRVTAGGSSGFIGTYSNHSLTFLTNSTNALTIASTGDATFSGSTLTLGTSGTLPTIKAGGANTDLQIEAVGSGGYLNLVTNGTSRIFIAAAGNVGIGTSSPTLAKVVIEKAGSVFPGLCINNTTSDEATIRFKSTHDANSDYKIGASIQIGSAFEIYSIAAAVTRMAITSGGNVLVNTTTQKYSTKLEVVSVGDAISSRCDNGGAAVICNPATTGSNSAFFQVGTTSAGYIGHPTSSTTLYATAPSDLRLKYNIEKWDENVLESFKNIKPKTFSNIADNDESIRYKGYIAQEMIDKFPEAYPIDKDGFYNYNPSGMVVYLTKAIQEQQVQIEELKQLIKNK
jgi:hypothetical protein